MDTDNQTCCTAFAGFRRIASGTLAQVALKTREVLDGGEKEAILIFDDVTAEQIEIDFRGTAEQVLKRLTKLQGAAVSTPEAEAPRGPGRRGSVSSRAR